MPIKENKFARQAENLIRRNTASYDEKTNIDQQLARLEEDIRRLKIEYDVFFNGGAKRAPYDTKNRVETTLKRLGDERSLTFAQRYQLNTLTARFTSFRELWRRTMQGREEGRDAATIARAAQHEAEIEAQLEAHKEIVKKPSVFTCGDVKSEADTVRKIFDAMLDAKRQCGENADSMSFERFRQQLEAQTERFKQNSGCQRVTFEIGTENGSVVFKARAER